MKFSKHWIQEYIIENLPEDAVIEAELNAKAFEVEGIEEYVVEGKKWDSIFDIKVLPNRAHDALGHKGMAREIATCLSLTFNPYPTTYPEINFDNSVASVNVDVVDTTACDRFMAVRMDGVAVAPSPDWLRMKIESIGQRSINNIVDITNYVQFALNKPMHAYDARSIDGGIVVRYANADEKLETLDDRESSLDEKTLVIADNKKALGLAGIKGGKYSGINPDTTSIIIESANFDPSLIRKTSQKYNIKTDASKRFENGIADTLVHDGLMMTVCEILRMYPEAKVGPVTDTNTNERELMQIEISKDEINNILGTDYSVDLIGETLKKLGFDNFVNDAKFTVHIPSERLDIRIKEDVAEEVGRVIGYDKLVPTLPKIDRVGKINKRLYYQNIIRNILTDKKFSEVITYSFTRNGEVELLKSASDKNRLRTNISEGLVEAMNKNIYNGPILNVQDISVFEFGNCFSSDSEWMSLSIGMDDGKKKSNYSEQMDMIISEIKKTIGAIQIEFEKTSTKPLVVEINFDSLIDGLPDPKENVYLDCNTNKEIKYKTFSQMPFIVRDIAFWADASIDKNEIERMIKSNAGDLCISTSLFDEFTKETRTSYGFRLIYQDKDRTLTDEEVNGYAENVYNALKGKGFEIR
jgi:phenylalanyl-tRNA synthetase beta chain